MQSNYILPCFQRGLPPTIRKSMPLETSVRRFISLPSIHSNDSRVRKKKSNYDSRKSTVNWKSNEDIIIDIEYLIETKIKNLKQNGFIYLMYSFPPTSEHFTPYSLM